MMVKHIRVWVVVMLVAGLLMSFSPGLLASTMDDVMARGKLIVGAELGTPPWTFLDPETGKITGFSIELARLFAEELGVKLEVRTYEWAGIIPSLLTGKVDMLATCLTRTVKRSVKLMYTEPYVSQPTQVLVRKGEISPLELEQLNNKDIILTVTTGSIWEEVAKKRLPNVTIRTNPTNADNAIALHTGRADAYVNDRRQLIAAMKMYPGEFELIPEPLAWDSFAFAVRYDSFKLWNTANLFMRLIKMDGRYQQLFKKWMKYEWKPTIEVAS